jgi:hypothetical protein
MSERASSMNEPARGRSVRFRLLAIALLPMLVILPLLLGVAIYRWNARFDATLISKVNGDLTIAHQYLARILEKPAFRSVRLACPLASAMWKSTIRCLPWPTCSKPPARRSVSTFST